MENKSNAFLRHYQLDAVRKAHNGCILNGGVGSGKSRTGLYYYYKENGGELLTYKTHVPMNIPAQDLYIITTAMKRDTLEWEKELANFFMSTDPEVNMYGNKIVIDSWNNIKKYREVTGAFFIFDEDRVTGSGAWVKSFWEITKHNNWIILSATPGDTWMDYMPVFVANGFYKNKTEFLREHAVFARYTKYPQIEKYIGVQRLIRLRDRILIDMEFERHTKPHNIVVHTQYDIQKYKEVIKNRWDPFKNEPIQQASTLCYILRKIVNSDRSRIDAIFDIMKDRDRVIIFYNFDYELELLRDAFIELNCTIDNYDDHYEVAEWNGHKHQPIPKYGRWVYLVQYTSGCEGWNCLTTDTIIFYSQNYSYKMLTQAKGRIDRLNSPFINLYYFHLTSRSSIDLGISRALNNKKNFNEGRWTKGKDE